MTTSTTTTTTHYRVQIADGDPWVAGGDAYTWYGDYDRAESRTFATRAEAEACAAELVKTGNWVDFDTRAPLTPARYVVVEVD